VTQQNAALVEQAAAAAESLEEQADQLTQLISTFRLRGERTTSVARGGGQRTLPIPPPRSASQRQAKPIPKVNISDDDEWKEF